MNYKLILLILLLTSVTCRSQSLTTSEKKQIMQELSSAIEKNYVLQDSTDQILSGLKAAQKSEEYRRQETPDQFARYLTNLLRSITSDAHFAIINNASMYKMAQSLAAGISPGSEEQTSNMISRSLNDSRKNFFFRKLEILNGNVGYLKIEQMPALEQAKSTVDAAMQFLQNSDALIIDLRSNPGGMGGFIPYLLSYFFSEDRQLLYKREFLAWDSTAYLYTYQKLGSSRYLNKEVYILINRFTGSAATNFAYTMKSFGKATLVGENTGLGFRGAHSASIFPLANNLVALVPVGRVINAKTGTNWREKGVNPDIPCPSENALNIAYENALQKLKNNAKEAGVIKDLDNAQSSLKEASVERSNSDNEDLSEYVGQYGETTISLENGKLYTKKPTVPIKLELKRKKGDLFEIVIPPNTRGNVPDLRFDRENGVIVSLTPIRNGIEEKTEARKKN